MSSIIQHIIEGNLLKFYKSKEWFQIRAEALRRDNYECQMCKEKGKYHKAENVHHINEVKHRPDLSLTLDNLLCLCIRCHNDVHDRLDQQQKKKDKFINEERW
ncbi:HNH endonuclease [Bacillus suaedae]|uniref:Putative HNH nuclease YajD n=1 Tax=Halalkalibacter suaedae TaxID=2822140 RepID=A0A940WV01_9BACI|nr:HNH endonuclease [Bacillus suaedae]MBP3951137.1 HNH endonuclease [Bacillus suaedae]